MSLITEDQLRSLRKSGGGTFAIVYPRIDFMPYIVLVDTLPYVTHGYFVADYKLCDPIPDVMLDHPSMSRTLDDAIDRGSSADNLIGFWRNPENNHWYIDSVAYFDNENDGSANAYAAAFGQLSFYDIANKKVIKTHG